MSGADGHFECPACGHFEVTNAGLLATVETAARQGRELDVFLRRMFGGDLEADTWREGGPRAERQGGA